MTGSHMALIFYLTRQEGRRRVGRNGSVQLATPVFTTFGKPRIAFRGCLRLALTQTDIFSHRNTLSLEERRPLADRKQSGPAITTGVERAGVHDAIGKIAARSIDVRWRSDCRSKSWDLFQV